MTKFEIIVVLFEGAVVYMACRSMTKAETAKQDILKHNPNAKLRLIHLDLNSLKSVKACVDEFLKGMQA